MNSFQERKTISSGETNKQKTKQNKEPECKLNTCLAQSLQFDVLGYK